MVRRRNAERFAQLLDEAAGDSQQHPSDPVERELVDAVRLARRLASVPDSFPVPAPGQTGYRGCLRSMLVNTADSDGVGATDPGPAPAPEPVCPRPTIGAHRCAGRRHRSGRRHPTGRADRDRTSGRRVRAVLVVGVTMTSLAFSGFSVASGAAGPGDPLYGLKRSTERAHLVLTASDLDRGQLYLTLARIRLDEAGTVRTEPARFSAVLTDMDAETRAGVQILITTALSRHDPATLDTVDAFVPRQRAALSGLLTGQSGPVRQRVHRSEDLLDDVGRRSALLRTSLPCAAAATRSDRLGPVPQRCPARRVDRRTGPPPLVIRSPAGPARPAPSSSGTDPVAGAPPLDEAGGGWPPVSPPALLPAPSAPPSGGATSAPDASSTPADGTATSTAGSTAASGGTGTTPAVPPSGWMSSEPGASSGWLVSPSVR